MTERVGIRWHRIEDEKPEPRNQIERDFGVRVLLFAQVEIGPAKAFREDRYDIGGIDAQGAWGCSYGRFQATHWAYLNAPGDVGAATG